MNRNFDLKLLIKEILEILYNRDVHDKVTMIQLKKNLAAKEMQSLDIATINHVQRKKH